MNLGIGLYYDRQGNIPLMQAVEAAEQRLLALRRPHGYPPIEGSPQFARQVQTLLFGEQQAAEIATVQTVGGSGALKLAADFCATFWRAVKFGCPIPPGPITGRFSKAPGCG